MVNNAKYSREINAYLTIFSVGTLFLFGYLAYMRVLHPETVFMDSLRFLTYAAESMSGKQSLWKTWNQGDHHGMLPQFVVYANARFFHLNVYVATVLGGCVALCSASVVCLRIAASFRAEISVSNNHGTPQSLIYIFTFAVFLSLSNWELYSIDVGLALFAKNLSFIVFWVFLDRYLGSELRSNTLRFALGFTAPLIILLVALGWAYPFIAVSLICIFWSGRATAMNRRIELSVILLSSLAAYIVIGFALPKPELTLPPVPPFWDALRNSAQGFFMGLSTTLFGEETMKYARFSAAEETFMGSIVFAFAALCLWLNFTKRRDGTLLPSALLLYAILDSMAVAAGRAKWDPWNATAARYYQDFSLILVGSIWSSALLLRKDMPTIQSAVRLSLVGLLSIIAPTFIVGSALTATQEWEKAAHRHNAFLHMREIVTSPNQLKDADALYMQQIPKYTASAIDAMKKYHLGPFSTGSD
jgi:hypothetical protein